MGSFQRRQNKESAAEGVVVAVVGTAVGFGVRYLDVAQLYSREYWSKKDAPKEPFT